MIGVSVDSEYTHHAWKNTPYEKGGIGDVQYPLVADITKEISRSYGVLFNESVALRGLFLIDKEGNAVERFAPTKTPEEVAEIVPKYL